MHKFITIRDICVGSAHQLIAFEMKQWFRFKGSNLYFYLFTGYSLWHTGISSHLVSQCSARLRTCHFAPFVCYSVCFRWHQAVPLKYWIWIKLCQYLFFQVVSHNIYLESLRHLQTFWQQEFHFPSDSINLCTECQATISYLILYYWQIGIHFWVYC